MSDNSGILIVGREDLFYFCRKIAFNMISFNDHIDINRMRREGKLGRNDIHNTKYIIFIDDDGTEKVLLNRGNYKEMRKRV